MVVKAPKPRRRLSQFEEWKTREIKEDELYADVRLINQQVSKKIDELNNGVRLKSGEDHPTIAAAKEYLAGAKSFDDVDDSVKRLHKELSTLYRNKTIRELASDMYRRETNGPVRDRLSKIVCDENRAGYDALVARQFDHLIPAVEASHALQTERHDLETGNINVDGYWKPCDFTAPLSKHTVAYAVRQAVEAGHLDSAYLKRVEGWENT